MKLCWPSLAAVLFLGVRSALAAAAEDTAFTDEQVKSWLAIEGARSADPRKDYTWKTFQDKHQRAHPGQPITAKELADYKPPSRPFDSAGNRLSDERSDFAEVKSPAGFIKKIKVRSNFDDVLSGEDPSVAIASPDASPSEKASDLTGATFSYSRDFKAKTDAWVAKGAVILPLTRVRDTNTSVYDIDLKSYGIAPSVSFDRETDGKDSSNDKSVLAFRFGGFWKWRGPYPYLTSLTLRLFATYGTDFGFHARLPASEFELEPVIPGRGPFGIGTLHFLRRSDTTEAEQFSLTNIGYQLRFIVHGQFGRVDAVGATPLRKEDFGRLGPKLKLRLDPLFTPRLTCDVNYEWQDDIFGHSPNHGLLSIEPALTLNKPPEDATTLEQPLLKLSASYQNGGLDLTKQKVRSVMVGLGITY